MRVRACVRACLRACVRACVCVGVRACGPVCVLFVGDGYTTFSGYGSTHDLNGYSLTVE